MQQNFSMKKIAAAVALTAGVSIAGIQGAQADSILFPYVVSSNTVTTIVSVVNHDSSANADLHYATFYKPAGAAESLTASCVEGNWHRNSSPEDIVTFDVSPHFGAGTGGVLFSDPGAAAMGMYAGDAFGFLSSVAPTRGFMMVANPVPDSSDDGELYGEALVMEYASGAAWGYRAYNAARSGFPAVAGADAAASANDWQFSNAFETNGEVLGPVDLNDNDILAGAGTYEQEVAAVELYPLTEWVNRFFVTPIGRTTNMTGNLNARISLTGWSSKVSNNAFWGLTTAFTDTVAFDRDEKPVSGAMAANVVCVGGVNMADLISTLGQTQIRNGGWTYANISAGTVPATVNPAAVATPEAVVQQLRYNPANTFNGEALTGTVNSTVWLRNNTHGLHNAIGVNGAGFDDYRTLGMQGF